MRVTFAAAALIALAAAASFVVRSEKQISKLISSARAFDLNARATADAFAELRSGQQAYVAASQGVAFWIPAVAATTDRAKTGIASLRVSARSGPGRQALMDAEATVADVETAEKRIREYLQAGDRLMAADVIFAEGGNAVVTAARQVEAARRAELQAVDADEAELRRQQAAALAGAAAVAATVVLLLVPIRGRKPLPALQQDSVRPAIDEAPAPPAFL